MRFRHKVNRKKRKYLPDDLIFSDEPAKNEEDKYFTLEGKLGFYNFRIHNIIAAVPNIADDHSPVDLNRMSEENKNTCSYQPDNFPGLSYKNTLYINGPEVKVNIFDTNKTVFMGNNNMKDLLGAYIHVKFLTQKYTSKDVNHDPNFVIRSLSSEQDIVVASEGGVNTVGNIQQYTSYNGATRVIDNRFHMRIAQLLVLNNKQISINKERLKRIRQCLREAEEDFIKKNAKDSRGMSQVLSLDDWEDIIEKIHAKFQKEDEEFLIQSHKPIQTQPMLFTNMIHFTLRKLSVTQKQHSELLPMWVGMNDVPYHNWMGMRFIRDILQENPHLEIFIQHIITRAIMDIQLFNLNYLLSRYVFEKIEQVEQEERVLKEEYISFLRLAFNHPYSLLTKNNILEITSILFRYYKEVSL